MKLIDNLKDLKNKFNKQTVEMPDGSIMTIKVRPKLGNKTKATITWAKRMSEDVDIQIMVQGKPIQCVQEGVGYNPNASESFRAEASATFKW